jgi:hypothetical protein
MQPKPEPKIIGVLDHETKYDIPFSKEKAEELLKAARNEVN